MACGSKPPPVPSLRMTSTRVVSCSARPSPSRRERVPAAAAAVVVAAEAAAGQERDREGREDGRGEPHAGSVSLNAVRPGAERTVSSPCIRSASSRAMARPSPAPREPSAEV